MTSSATRPDTATIAVRVALTWPVKVPRAWRSTPRNSPLCQADGRKLFSGMTMTSTTPSSPVTTPPTR